MDVNKIIEKMTVGEKVGQLCVPILQKGEITEDLKEYVQRYNVGMIRFCPNAEFDNSSEVVGEPNRYRTPSEMAGFTNAIQNMAKIPLFFAVDQEGGSRNDINRGGAFAYGGHMEFGAADDTELTYKVAKATGEEFAAMGINMVQAPIVDVLTYDGRKTMKAATFGENAAKVSEHALAMMKGFKDGGIAPMAKHFPGYGSVATDAHKGIAEIFKDFNSLDEEDIKPMKVLFGNGLAGVMTGHVITHCIDSEYPATVSKKVITKYLRETLGFDGIVETDAMRMPAIQKLYGTGRACVLALEAGCDLVLLRGNMQHFKEGYEAVLNAVQKGEISEKRLDESVRRMLKQKEAIGLFDKKTVCAELADKIVGSREHKELAKELAEKSVTVFRRENLPAPKETKILSVFCEPQKIRAAMDSVQSIDMLGQALKMNFENVDEIIVKLSPDETDEKKVLCILENYDMIVFASCNAIINEAQVKFLKKIAAKHDNVTVIAMESPFDLEILEKTAGAIATYGVSREAMNAVSDCICGKLKGSAKPPVALNIK